MPEGEVRRPLLFGMSNGGEFEPVGKVSETFAFTSDTDDGPYYDPSVFDELSATVEVGLEEYGDALAKLGTVFHATGSQIQLMFDRIVRAPRFWYIWQYKSHPKGRGRRRRRPSWMRVKTVLHDVEVESSGDIATFRAVMPR